MDLNYSNEELAFRDEVRGWLAKNLPADLSDKVAGHEHLSRDDLVRWHKILAKQGWIAPSWPKEWGGNGWNVVQRYIFEEECGYAGTPPLVPFGLSMCAPVLHKFGTEAQKKRFLPRIYNADDFWCQGYSEPGSGSDLASLQMKAVQEGDEFVVTGQKIWTSHADKSDWIFCLVRTDPSAKKQQGISFLLIDLQSRGVSSRPISLISGSSPFCEVFMDEVRVPARNLVGKLNEGWTIAKALLGFERTMIGDAIGGQMAQAESLLLASAREQYGVAEGEPLDALSRDAIARIAMDERAFGLVRERIRQTTESGKTPGPESSITKAYGADLKQRRYELAMRLLGPEAVGWEGAPFDQTGLDTGREWLRARANSIEGGSSEIQLNVIAQHVLGLPK